MKESCGASALEPTVLVAIILWWSCRHLTFNLLFGWTAGLIGCEIDVALGAGKATLVEMD